MSRFPQEIVERIIELADIRYIKVKFISLMIGIKFVRFFEENHGSFDEMLDDNDVSHKTFLGLPDTFYDNIFDAEDDNVYFQFREIINTKYDRLSSKDKIIFLQLFAKDFKDYCAETERPVIHDIKVNKDQTLGIHYRDMYMLLCYDYDIYGSEPAIGELVDVDDDITQCFEEEASLDKRIDIIEALQSDWDVYSEEI